MRRAPLLPPLLAGVHRPLYCFFRVHLAHCGLNTKEPLLQGLVDVWLAYLTPWRARLRCSDARRRLPPSARFAAAMARGPGGGSGSGGGGGGGGGGRSSGMFGAFGWTPSLRPGASARDDGRGGGSSSSAKPLDGPPGDFASGDADNFEAEWQYWIAAHYWVRLLCLRPGVSGFARMCVRACVHACVRARWHLVGRSA